jgi:septum formation topological specificity factor MinE
MDSALGTSRTAESRTTATERLQILIANIETNTMWIKKPLAKTDT